MGSGSRFQLPDPIFFCIAYPQLNLFYYQMWG